MSSTAAGGGAFSSATGGSGQKAQIDAGGTQGSSVAAAAEQAASSGACNSLMSSLIDAMTAMSKISASGRDSNRCSFLFAWPCTEIVMLEVLECMAL